MPEATPEASFEAVASPAEPLAPPSAHLLRTLAVIPPSARVLDLGCGDGRHTVPLAQLGFDVWACDPDGTALATARARLADVLGPGEATRRATPARLAALGYPDDHFDWVVACALDRLADAEALVEALHEARRVMKPGAWLFASIAAAPFGDELTLETFAKLFAEAGFALSEEPALDAIPEPVVRGIFRKVTPETVG